MVGLRFFLTAAGIAAASAPAVAADPSHGKALFAQCAACHGETGAGTNLGPSLIGVLGRPAGQLRDFHYSRAMQQSGIVWSEGILIKYLVDPQSVVPGNRMPFAGLDTPEDGEDVASYIENMNK